MDAGYKDYGYSDAKSESHHEYLLPALRSLLGNSGDPILDIGCGNGCITRALLNDGFNVYGVDASESGIRIAEAAAPGRFHLMNIASGALPETLAELPFKTIISTEVIGHLYNPRGLLDFSRSILQKSGGGRLVLSTPYHGYFKNVVLALADGFDAHHGVLWDGGIIKFFSRSTLEQMLREQGFTVTGFVGAGRLPWLWKSMFVSAELRDIS